MKKYVTEKTEEQKCPNCGLVAIPVRRQDEPHEKHGYKFECPDCGRFMGWGGQVQSGGKQARNERYRKAYYEKQGWTYRPRA